VRGRFSAQRSNLSLWHPLSAPSRSVAPAPRSAHPFSAGSAPFPLRSAPTCSGRW